MALDKRMENPLAGGDPAVDAVMSDPVYGRMSRARNQTAAQRKKAEREKLRNKATFDLPVWLTDILDDLAAIYGCPRNEILSALALSGLVDIIDDRLNLGSFREVTRSLRFEYKLVIEPEFDLQKVKNAALAQLLVLAANKKIRQR